MIIFTAGVFPEGGLLTAAESVSAGWPGNHSEGRGFQGRLGHSSSSELRCRGVGARHFGQVYSAQQL